MALEGELLVALGLSRGRVSAVQIRSTRPDVAGALLRGRRRAEVLAAVPRLFSICGRSQLAACELACATAAGETASAERLASQGAAVAAEVLREGAWRMLLDWPRWLDEAPTDEAIAAARGAVAPAMDDAHRAGGTAEAIATAAFGSPAAEWLALETVAEIDRWIDAGRSATARFMRRVRDSDEPASAEAAAAERAVPLLATPCDAAVPTALAAAAEADPDFSRQPTWRGAPAETGALARLQADPLVVAVLQRSATRTPARFLARLRELALLLAGRTPAALGALAIGPGAGVAWVENARGLLVHQVRLDGDRVVAYRIVAPTEWNFHPAGVLARSLAGQNAGNPDQVKARARVLVHALDPCVACRIEIEHA